MGAVYTKSQSKASLEYLKRKNLKSVTIRITECKKEEYNRLAKSEGKSLNQFIIDCIEKRTV